MPEVKEFSVLISSICIYDRIFVGQVFTIPLYIYEHKGDRRQERRRNTLLPLLINYTYISFGIRFVGLIIHTGINVMNNLREIDTIMEKKSVNTEDSFPLII